MLAGYCSEKEYERWVRQDGKEYAAAKEQSQPASNSRYSADLVAAYEELMKVPGEEQITAYFGDYGLHHFKDGVTEKEIRPVYEKALAAIEMTEEEFNARHSQFAYRGEIIGRMRDCLLPSVLKVGEEYLFVATEPYGGDGDFALRGGILLGVDTNCKTLYNAGRFFHDGGCSLRYILAKTQSGSHGKALWICKGPSRCSVNTRLWRSNTSRMLRKPSTRNGTAIRSMTKNPCKPCDYKKGVKPI